MPSASYTWGLIILVIPLLVGIPAAWAAQSLLGAFAWGFGTTWLQDALWRNGWRFVFTCSALLSMMSASAEQNGFLSILGWHTLGLVVLSVTNLFYFLDRILDWITIASDHELVAVGIVGFVALVLTFATQYSTLSAFVVIFAFIQRYATLLLTADIRTSQ